MVDKKRCRDIAVLFDKDLEAGTEGEIYRIYPVKTIEGYFDCNEGFFISKDNIAFEHIVLVGAGLNFGKRISKEDLLKKYPDLSLKDARKKYLDEIGKYDYYCSLEDLDDYYWDNNLLAIDPSNGNMTVYDDDDFEFILRNTYSEHFDSNEGENLEITKIGNSYNITIKSSENIAENDLKKDSIIKELNVQEIYEELCKNVIGQEEAHKRILSTIWYNYSNMDIKKSQNIFVNGPTGVGKTETFRTISKVINVPFIIEDCNDFTMAGYVGRDVKEIIQDLVKKANNDIFAAEHGIVVLDEVDKLAGLNPRENVSTTGVQDALLKILEDGNYAVGGKTINTKNITFVGLGAFSGVEELEPPKMGFLQETTKKAYKDIDINDIVKYGIKPEFIGRFNSILSMRELKEEDLVKILKISKLSPLIERINQYKEKNIELIYDDTFIIELAKEAKKLNLGARGLLTVLEKAIYEAQLDIAFNNQKMNYNKLILNGETVTNPKKYILKRD